MHYVGLDVHSKQSTFCVLDDQGREVRTATVHGGWGKLLVTLKEALPRPFSICYEASTGYGYLFKHLSAMAATVRVAHPGHLRLIFRSKRKNDRIDAQRLAKLLYLGEVPSVHVPHADVQAWRSLIGYRIRQVQERTRVKNTIRALLRSHGIEALRGLWTRKGIAWLNALPFASPLIALQRDILLKRYHSLKDTIKQVEKYLDEVAKRHPGVCLLMTIPGVGVRTAEAVVAHIDTPKRFSRSKQIGSYFGLVPCLDESAGVSRYGHITRNGPSAVRFLLTQASWSGIRRSPHLRAYFDRIVGGDKARRKKALVATAHYLARVMLAMLKSGEIWRYDNDEVVTPDSQRNALRA